MAMDEVHVEELILDYILSIVRTTREADKATSGLSKYIDFGASPRASLSLLAASKFIEIDLEELVDNEPEEKGYEI